MIGKIELHLQDWTAHYPTGVMMYDTTNEILDSDYADTVDEYKEFIDRHREEIKKDKPQVIALIDMDDMDISNVLEVAKEVNEYIKSIIGESY